jgi:8-oxo-dGTP diphosphatase
MALHPGESGYDTQEENRAARVAKKLPRVSFANAHNIVEKAKEIVCGPTTAELIIKRPGMAEYRTHFYLDRFSVSGSDDDKFLAGLAFSPGKVHIELHGRRNENPPKIKPTLPVGVSVLLTDNAGRLLLGRRKNNTGAGLLSTPGGRLEQHENMFECAAREFAEETGAQINELTLIGVKEHFRFNDHYIMLYVHAKQYSGTISNPEPDKCEGWEFKSLLDIRPEETTEPTDILARLAAILAGW